jgi:hypothetical protein
MAFPSHLGGAGQAHVEGEWLGRMFRAGRHAPGAPSLHHRNSARVSWMGLENGGAFNRESRGGGLNIKPNQTLGLVWVWLVINGMARTCCSRRTHYRLVSAVRAVASRFAAFFPNFRSLGLRQPLRACLGSSSWHLCSGHTTLVEEGPPRPVDCRGGSDLAVRRPGPRLVEAPLEYPHSATLLQGHH